MSAPTAQGAFGSIVRVLELTSNDVVEVQRSEYSAFGVLVGRTTASSFDDIGGQPFGFAGGLFDPVTGLTRFGARDYDPRLGRWLARDPLGFGAGDTNLFAYVGGDPVNLVDPAGLAWFPMDNHWNHSTAESHAVMTQPGLVASTVLGGALAVGGGWAAELREA